MEKGKGKTKELTYPLLNTLSNRLILIIIITMSVLSVEHSFRPTYYYHHHIYIYMYIHIGMYMRLWFGWFGCLVLVPSLCGFKGPLSGSSAATPFAAVVISPPA